MGHVAGSLAGFDVTVVQSQGDQLLKAGIDLVVHGGVLWDDAAELLQQAAAAVIVVAFRVLQSLSVVGRGLLDRLQRVGLGLSGAGALHGLRARRNPGNPALASVVLLLLGLATGGGSIRGAQSVRRGVVVNPSHVVKKIPPTRESKSGNGAVASLEEAQVGVVTVTMQSVGLPFVAEQAGIG